MRHNVRVAGKCRGYHMDPLPSRGERSFSFQMDDNIVSVVPSAEILTIRSKLPNPPKRFFHSLFIFIFKVQCRNASVNNIHSIGLIHQHSCNISLMDLFCRGWCDSDSSAVATINICINVISPYILIILLFNITF